MANNNNIIKTEDAEKLDSQFVENEIIEPINKSISKSTNEISQSPDTNIELTTKDSKNTEIANNKKSFALNTLFHPLSALSTITIDWAFFGADALSSGLSTPATVIIAFSLNFLGSFLIQKFLAKDGGGASLAKAFVLGLAAGIPTPIAGTAIGGVLLGISGINQLQNKKK